MHRVMIAVAALVSATTPLAGQKRAHQFEVGAFGAYTHYDAAFNLSDPFGGGARFGYFITNNVGLEVEIDFLSQLDIPGSSSVFEPIIGAGSLLVNFPFGGIATLYALGGYSRLDFATTDPYKFTDSGIHAGAGVRLSLSRNVALRFEGRAIFTPQSGAAFTTESVRHLVASAGFSVFQVSGRNRGAQPAPPVPVPTVAATPAPVVPGDADADGVSDGTDACPGTPTGATVDAAGCPADADGDRVYDGIDQCPATPAGATVDAAGCPSDADGDRVYDGIDQCPETPPGASANALGCPADEDADRVPDGVDQCPGTSLGATVDARGCPTDSDGDKVFDGIDQCPNTPAGALVDEVGCQSETVQAPKDSDGDGVMDDADRCPNTPRGSQVDGNGCVILFREEPGAKAAALVLQGVTFMSGRSVIAPASYATLDAVASSLVANPDVRIEIAGHTDDTGADALNLRLSQARASAVQAYLARKGVAPDRMVARGYGETQPAVPNATPQGRATNRRVELRRIN